MKCCGMIGLTDAKCTELQVAAIAHVELFMTLLQCQQVYYILAISINQSCALVKFSQLTKGKKGTFYPHIPFIISYSLLI